MAALVFLVCAFLLCRCASASGSSDQAIYDVILDVDAAAFVRTGLDVNDDLAVLLAFANHQRFNILGINAAFGNAPVQQTFQDLQLLQKITGRSVPLYRGASFFSSTEQTNASFFLMDTVRTRLEHQANGEHMHPLVLVMLGAMTNLAVALNHARHIMEAPGGVDAVVILGGDLNSKNWFDFDINFLIDRASANTVLESSLPKILVPVQTCIQVALTEHWLNGLHTLCCPKTGHRAAVCTLHHRLIWQATAMPYLLNWAYRGNSEFSQSLLRGSIPFDLVAVATLTAPTAFSKWERARAKLPKFSTQIEFVGEITKNASLDVLSVLITNSQQLVSSDEHRNMVSIPRGLNKDIFLDHVAESLCAVRTVDKAEPVKTIPGFATEIAIALAGIVSVIAAILFAYFCGPTADELVD